jgi:hypothetical protein
VFGAVELLGNEPSIPAQDRVGFRDAGDLPKRLLPEPFSDLGESRALRIAQTQPRRQLGSQDSILSGQIFVPQQKLLVHRATDIS